MQVMTTETQFPEALYIRVNKGVRDRIKRAARSRARRIGVASQITMAEFVRFAVAEAIERERIQKIKEKG